MYDRKCDRYDLSTEPIEETSQSIAFAFCLRYGCSEWRFRKEQCLSHMAESISPLIGRLYSSWQNCATDDHASGTTDVGRAAI